MNTEGVLRARGPRRKLDVGVKSHVIHTLLEYIVDFLLNDDITSAVVHALERNGALRR